MKNYADQGGCYPPRLEAEVDNILQDLHNSSHHSIILFYYSLVLVII